MTRFLLMVRNTRNPSLVDLFLCLADKQGHMNVKVATGLRPEWCEDFRQRFLPEVKLEPEIAHWIAG